MNELGIRISYNIKKIMREQDMKQWELGEKLGKTRATISSFFKRLETGGCSNVKSLQEIADVLGVDISIFFAK